MLMVADGDEGSRRPRSAHARTTLGLALCWLAIAADRLGADRPGDLWWAWYVAIAVMTASALAGWARVFAGALLLHLAVGAPAYALQVAVTGQAEAAAVVVHLLPAMLGVLAIRHRAWPRGALPMALGLYLMCRGAAWGWTDPTHNVNLAHHVWHPMRRMLANTPLAQLGEVVAIGVLLTIGDAAARGTWRGRSAR